MLSNAFAKLRILKSACPAVVSVRHGHRIRGKPYGVAKSIEERLESKLRLCFTLHFCS